MTPYDHARAFEDRFHGLVAAVMDLLALEMDDTFLTLFHDAAPHSPQRRTAEAANRIVVLCRRLDTALHRYERWEQLRRQEEELQVEDPQDVPF
jgi:hypothetical protein